MIVNVVDESGLGVERPIRRGIVGCERGERIGKVGREG